MGSTANLDVHALLIKWMRAPLFDPQPLQPVCDMFGVFCRRNPRACRPALKTVPGPAGVDQVVVNPNQILN